MTIELRLEQPEDHRETECMVREAFWNHFVPGCDEHYLVNVMRNNPAFIPELDYVAVHEGKIIGSAMYAKGLIRGDDGNECKVACLGPLAVSPEHQNLGIGRKLIEVTLEAARNQGFRAAVLCGDPAYYERRGFEPAEKYGIRTEDNKYLAALQIRNLSDEPLTDLRGRYIEAEVYHVDPEEAEAFDKGFPAKEKVEGAPSQLRFQELLAQQRDADE